MYADKVTESMQYALDETNRRREIQIAHNTKHGIDPQPLRKRIADITDQLAREDADTEDLMSGMAGIKTGFDYGMGKRGYTATITENQQQQAMSTEDGQVAKLAAVPAKDLSDLIDQMSQQMHQAAVDLNFELAARLRDEVSELKKELRDMQREGHA